MASNPIRDPLADQLLTPQNGRSADLSGLNPA